MPSPLEYREVCTALWPNYPLPEVFATFDTINEEVFRGEVPMRGITVEQLPYGRCTGMTRTASGVIALSRQIMEEPPEEYLETLLHEMLHAYLHARGEDPKHNGEPWCREIMRITPLLGGPVIVASPVVRKRKPKSEGGTLYRDHKEPGSMPRTEFARWPHTVPLPPSWWTGLSSGRRYFRRWDR